MERPWTCPRLPWDGRKAEAEGWDREWRAGTGNGALERCLLTVLGEEVAVHDLDEAVELLDGQAAHGHVQDELGEQLAAHTGKGKSH